MVALPPVALIFPSLLYALQANDSYTIFADETGAAHLVRIDDIPLTLGEVTSVEASLDGIIFTLYTRANLEGEVLVPGNVELLRKSNWDPSKPTRIVTHGWRGYGTTSSCTLPRDAYLEAGDYNVIIMDWNVIANSLMYHRVASSVPMVAQYLGRFIDFLEFEGQLDPDNTKLVGHSLGAHIVSLGANIAHGIISEVVALDPARPRFEGVGPDSRVDASHAKNVQIIHTNGGYLGLTTKIGTSDFFPNGGTTQPGCPIYDVVGVCAHQRSWMYFSESIRNPTGFVAWPINAEGTTGADARSVYMGGPSLDPTAEGPYDLRTRSESPFALGG